MEECAIRGWLLQKELGEWLLWKENVMRGRKNVGDMLTVVSKCVVSEQVNCHCCKLSFERSPLQSINCSPKRILESPPAV